MEGCREGYGSIFPNPTLAVSITDAQSLSYHFTVDPQTRPRQPWCVVQGQVDGKAFLSYDCGGSKIEYMSPLGEEVKTTEVWKTQAETLGIRELLKEQLPDITWRNT